jgi:hypothetical protein
MVIKIKVQERNNFFSVPVSTPLLQQLKFWFGGVECHKAHHRWIQISKIYTGKKKKRREKILTNQSRTAA